MSNNVSVIYVKVNILQLFSLFDSLSWHQWTLIILLILKALIWIWVAELFNITFKNLITFQEDTKWTKQKGPLKGN